MFTAPLSLGQRREPSREDIEAVRRVARDRIALVNRRAQELQQTIERKAIDLQNAIRLRGEGRISPAQALSVGRDYENTIKVYDREFARLRQQATDAVRTEARRRRVPLTYVPELAEIKAMREPWARRDS